MNEQITLVDLEDMLSDIDDLQTGIEHTNESIAAAEKALGITLPNNYKLFLRKWGNLSFGPIEYYGLTNSLDFDSAGIPNFVWFTLRKREQVNIPDSLVIFQNVNDEIYYCLDTSTLSNNECKVVSWNNLTGEIEETFDIGFFGFLAGDLEEYTDMMS
jgi:hypothetical protein